MARSFRYYGKKRGHRRTGSSKLGIVGESLFWAVLLLLGCVGTVLVAVHFVVPEWRVAHEFRATSCKVLDKRVGEKKSDDGPLYRPELYIEYEVGRTSHSGWHFDIRHHDLDGGYSAGRDAAQAVLDRFDVYDAAKRNRYPCWYDPTNHGIAVLQRGYRWWTWFLFTVPISFVLIGTGGLIYAALHWGKSAERRASLRQRRRQRDTFGGNGDRLAYPSIPTGADMTNSPGTKLQFRLPMARSPGWALFGTLALCVVLNGIVAIYAAIAIKSHLAGQPDWSLTLFVSPFALIGMGTIVVFLRQLLVVTGVGPTLVEISDHPLHCGHQYRVFVSQSGRLRLKRVRATLVCEESATYCQGTNTRTETQEVHHQVLFQADDVTTRSDVPFETELEFSIPERAMHSFKSDHNDVNWALTVEGDVAGWRPNFNRSFPLIVRPSKRSSAK